MPSELQDLIQRIPTAEEGGVITSMYHNTLRAAIQSLASQVGVPMGQTLLTIAPGFFPNDPIPNWPQHNGIAVLSLEVANLGEIQARARAEAEVAASAATTAAARARDAAAALNGIPVETLPIAASAAATSNEAAARADEAVAAARALVEAVAQSDAEAKANEAVAKAEAALTAAVGALNLVSATLGMASSSPFGFPSPFLAFASAANASSHAAFASAGEAFEKAKAAATAITEAAGAQSRVKAGTCAGWLPLALPDGAHIQNMVVFYRRLGTIQRFQVDLVRQDIRDSSEAVIISISLAQAEEPFRVRADVQTPRRAPEDSLVDNAAYKYLITSRVDAVAGAVAQISAIQITYSM